MTYEKDRPGAVFFVGFRRFKGFKGLPLCGNAHKVSVTKLHSCII